MAVIRDVRPTTGGEAKDWITERMKEYYLRPQRAVEYRSHAAWSLRQLDDKFSLLKPDMVVVDLGCFPGGWSEVALERTCASSSSGRVIGVDMVQMDPLPNHTFVQGDVGDDATLAKLQEALGDRRADIVLSDLAPPRVGLKQEDHLGSMQCCLHAAKIMERTLRLGGWFVAKTLWGPEQGNWRAYLNSRFKFVRTIKPAASRRVQQEMFLVCRGFLGRHSIAEEVQKSGLDLTKHEGRDRWDGERRS